ncbi:autorepressor SdpR family transcription factor [Bacillus sp. M6-12]|uniref:autorepressor SdpR family transcription factor n=1 Tax=Bacillus sp. M6-12 TaxID=2054166 RepID=UPI00115BC2C2|nr:autorepressor SdpR family transcription factor [Bacillus sp. M6-12]
MDSLFKALSDKNRRKILNLLKEKDLSAGEIAESFSISKPSLSHHLGILKEAELVLVERQGKQLIYSLNTTVFQEVISWFFNFKERE